MAATDLGRKHTGPLLSLMGARVRARGRSVTERMLVAPLVLLDGSAVTMAMVVAYHMRFRLLSYYSDFSPEFYTWFIALSVPVWIGIFAVYRLYDPEMLFGGIAEYVRAVHGCTAGSMAIILYAFVDHRADTAVSRGWLALTWVLSVVGVNGFRFAYRRLVYALRQRGRFLSDVLVIGTNAEGRLVAQQLLDNPRVGLRVIGFVGAGQDATDLGESLPPKLGGLDDLPELIRARAPDELLIIPTALSREALLGIYRDWGTDPQLRLRLSSGLYELLTTGVYVRDTGSIPLVSIGRTRITGLDAWLKAVVDYVGAALALVILSPFLLGVALWVALDSPGGVIYRRRVVGLNGRTFDAFKFRTMRPDADEYLAKHPELKAEWDQHGKLKDDPRITRAGRFLRRYSIDELPQLVNVLRGEMSLVGPRMITPEELVHFGCWQCNLLTVKPGLTGLWQVSGRAELSYEARVELDMRYIRNYSLWLDLRIMISTVFAVLGAKGAY